jgi:hypothetical protein
MKMLSESKRLLGGPRRGWEDNFNMNFKEGKFEGID